VVGRIPWSRRKRLRFWGASARIPDREIDQWDVPNILPPILNLSGAHNEGPLSRHLLGLAISFAVPAFTRQKDTIDSEMAEQVIKKFDEAFNNGDAAAVAAIYTEDPVQVTPQGPIFGREAIEKLFAGMFQQGHYSDRLSKDDQGSLT
jgi:SnoaL-like domain